MNHAPIKEQIQVEPGQEPKIVTMRPAWAVWFTEAYRILSGAVVSAVRAATATTASYLDFATEASAKTSGVATLTAAGADLLTLDLGTVTAGQKYWIEGQIKDGTKGGTAGTTKMSILLSSGAATIKFMNDATELVTSSVITASITLSCFKLGGILHITGSGTCVMKIRGLSAGSDTTVAAGDVQIYATRMK